MQTRLRCSACGREDVAEAFGDRPQCPTCSSIRIVDAASGERRNGIQFAKIMTTATAAALTRGPK